MKKSGFLMLLLITFLVALPVAADGLSLSDDLLTVEISETKIFMWEELAVMSYSENVAAPAVISIQENAITSTIITTADIGFQMDEYKHCYGGVLAYLPGYF